MNWFRSNMIGNMRLKLSEDDAESAKEILAQQVPEKFETNAESFEQSRCPKCGSEGLQFCRYKSQNRLRCCVYDWRAFAASTRQLECNHCGAEWQKDGHGSAEAAEEPSDS